MKHEVIIETEHATLGLSLSRQTDPTVCVSNHLNVRSVQLPHDLHNITIKFKGSIDSETPVRQYKKLADRGIWIDMSREPMK